MVAVAAVADGDEGIMRTEEPKRTREEAMECRKRPKALLVRRLDPPPFGESDFRQLFRIPISLFRRICAVRVRCAKSATMCCSQWSG